jgi:hypothetical protein
VEENIPTRIDESGDSVEKEYIQQTIPPQTASHIADHYKTSKDESDTIDQSEAFVYETPQLADEMPYQAESQQKNTPVLVSHEPVVDYQTSVREMKSALETRMDEMQRITWELRDLNGGDDHD